MSDSTKTVAQDATPDAPAARLSANAAAVLIGDAIGRPLTAKHVRQMARENIAAYQDEAYTPHAYDRDTLLVLLSLFGKRGAGRGTVSVPRKADGTPDADALAKLAGISAADRKAALAGGGK